MPLTIRFINKTDYEPGVALGEITLDDFVESFESWLTFWNVDQYENQWREGIHRLLEGAPKSCLITSIAEPKYEHFGAWWKLYRDGEYVVVQNQLLLSMVLGNNFNSGNPYEFIPDRSSFSEDGVAVSEWCIKFNSIRPL